MKNKKEPEDESNISVHNKLTNWLSRLFCQNTAFVTHKFSINAYYTVISASSQAERFYGEKSTRSRF